MIQEDSELLAVLLDGFALAVLQASLCDSKQQACF